MAMTEARPLAVVTGASSGIGYELAKQFAQHGYDLVVVAEDAGITGGVVGDFEALGAHVEPVQADLADYDGVERLYARVRATGRPVEAVYAASKAFELSFAEALRNELKDAGITVTALMPGPTDTEFFDRAGMQDTKVAGSNKDDPAQVANQGFEALMKGKDHVVAGSLKNKVMAAASKVTPEAAKAQLHRGMSKPGTGGS